GERHCSQRLIKLGFNTVHLVLTILILHAFAVNSQNKPLIFNQKV
ncbi:MAG: hypothetical protein ACI9YU_002209, partial [Flavobacteriales bacterium]